MREIFLILHITVGVTSVIAAFLPAFYQNKLIDKVYVGSLGGVGLSGIALALSGASIGRTCVSAVAFVSVIAFIRYFSVKNITV